ncbi:DMT family transporter [Bacillus testis]|uniref:DMT family transporter n=1 Tax=Bacillus testis TaxID=1622072 RepID=UPI00067F6763|nr:DMT family transporter [Bacillus testis]
MEKPKYNPYFLLAIGVFSVSTSAIFVKLSTAPSGVIAFYRLFFSVVVMLPIFVWKCRPELKRITKRDWLLMAAAGIFLAFHFILWFESLRYTSVASSTVLVTIQPLFAFVGAFLFFKESISMKGIISGLIAIAGSFIISWGDFKISGMALFGDVLALIACGLITAYLLIGQDVRRRITLVAYTFLVYSASSIVLFLYVLIRKQPLLHYPVSDWMYFLLLALIPTLLGHTLFNWSVRWISATTISMAILLEPIGAAILAYFVLDETVAITQAIGGIIVIAGLCLFLIDERSVKTKAGKIRS